MIRNVSILIVLAGLFVWEQAAGQKLQVRFLKLYLLKCLVFVFIFNSLIGKSFAEEVAPDAFYYYYDEKIPLNFNNDLILIKIEEGTSETEINNILSEYQIFDTSGLDEPVEKGVFYKGIRNNTKASTIKAVLEKLLKEDRIISATPTYTYLNHVLGVTDEFFVKLLSPDDFDKLKEFARKTNTIIKEQRNELTYTMLSTKTSSGDALTMANYFHESELFEWAVPNFYRILQSYCVNDEFFENQWALENTGQNGGTTGSDINICTAWEITEGRDEIRIAIIDDGVDLDHPDLQDNLVQGFDATNRNEQGGQEGNDAHGTAVAGVAAAVTNNDIGIAGVAPETSIIPIRMSFDNPSVTNDGWVADAFNWACDNGEADIINFSWGFTPSALIDDAIINCVNNGRDGLGTIIFVASGNYDDDNISYPASHPETISVGATDNNDTRASTNNWGTGNGSNYGEKLDIVAPGDNIFTTDVAGINGYTQNDYTFIDGTSFAAPHAAGVMSLILSVNRCLTYVEAYEILMLSAEKVGPYCYQPTTGRDHGTWNIEMGYGRLNAHTAVQLAHSSDHIYSFSGSGTVTDISDPFLWTLSSGGCSELSGGFYEVERYTIEKTVNYPHIPNPIVIGYATGFSAANPNPGNYWMQVVSIDENSAIIRTYVYNVLRNMSGQQLGWAPTSPSNIEFNFSIVSALENNVHLQNQTVNSGEHNIYALNAIASGNNVTNDIPQGDYIVDNSANVILQAGNQIILSEGTIIKPSTGSFEANIGPLFTCQEYPAGKRDPGGERRFPISINFNVAEEVTEAKKNGAAYIVNKPNPFIDHTTIEFYIPNDEVVKVEIYDLNGTLVETLINNKSLLSGIHEVDYIIGNFSPGVYIATLRTSKDIYNTKMILTE